MTADIYRVSPAMQAAGAASVTAAVASLDAELADINAEVSNLIATWDSEAQQAYLARQQQWNSASDNIKSALQQFSTGLTNASDTAASAERTNVGVVA